VRNAVGDAVFEILLAFIAFVRTAQFWTETHPELAIEPDMVSVLERNEDLAKLLLDPADAESMKAGEGLRQALAELEDVKASLRVSSEMLELALQSASQFAWEVGFDTLDVKTTGDTRSTFGFDIPANLEKYLVHVHPEDVPTIAGAYGAALAGERPVEQIEHRLINPITGETVWVHSTGRLVSANGRARLVGIARNITTEKKRQEQLGVLVGELQHRTRNLISVVAAIADRTLMTSMSFDDFKTSFQDRLGALARVQGLFFRMTEGDRVTFDKLLETELSAQSVHIGDDGSVMLDGPEGVRLRSGTVQALALVLHELVTNALKYGALKQPNGRLALRWRVGDEGGEPWLHFDWKESGVRMPPAGTAPQGTGQGRELIEQSLRYQFAARTTYALEANGVHFSLSLPVSKLGQGR
jgi:two-component system, chemotaxis family, CheB/CheR fusion protein